MTIKNSRSNNMIDGVFLSSIIIILLSSSWIQNVSSFALSSSTSTASSSTSINKNKKNVLLIFGNGNVAQSVIKYATSSYTTTNNSNNMFITTNDDNDDNTSKMNMDISCYDDDQYFDSIYCTYYNDSNDNNNHPITQTTTIPVSYIPFEETSILNILPIVTHVLITIPPQRIMNSNDEESKVEEEEEDSQQPKPSQQHYYYQDIILNSNNKLKQNLFQKIQKCTNNNNNNNNNNDDTTTNSINIQKIAYISTTGVYGNHNGEWVNELSNIYCKNHTKAHGYFMIEQQWIHNFIHALKDDVDNFDEEESLKLDCHLCIFRCAGLYGNEFSALHTIRKNGWNDIDGSSSSSSSSTQIPITSRVHLDDVGRAIVAYFIQDIYDKENLGESDNGIMIINLADNTPTSREEVMKYAYTLLQNENIHVMSSTFASNNLENDTPLTSSSINIESERATRRGIERKRVSNDKMTLLLKPYGGLKYPSFREGLMDILTANVEEWRSDII